MRRFVYSIGPAEWLLILSILRKGVTTYPYKYYSPNAANDLVETLVLIRSYLKYVQGRRDANDAGSFQLISEAWGNCDPCVIASRVS